VWGEIYPSRRPNGLLADEGNLLSLHPEEREARLEGYMQLSL